MASTTPTALNELSLDDLVKKDTDTATIMHFRQQDSKHAQRASEHEAALEQLRTLSTEYKAIGHELIRRLEAEIPQDTLDTLEEHANLLRKLNGAIVFHDQQTTRLADFRYRNELDEIFHVLKASVVEVSRADIGDGATNENGTYSNPDTLLITDHEDKEPLDMMSNVSNVSKTATYGSNSSVSRENDRLNLQEFLKEAQAKAERSGN